MSHAVTSAHRWQKPSLGTHVVTGVVGSCEGICRTHAQSRMLQNTINMRHLQHTHTRHTSSEHEYNLSEGLCLKDIFQLLTHRESHIESTEKIRLPDSEKKLLGNRVTDMPSAAASHAIVVQTVPVGALAVRSPRVHLRKSQRTKTAFSLSSTKRYAQ